MDKYTVSPEVYFEWIKHKPIANSALVLLNKDNCVLLGRRSFGVNKGKWELPSGGIEKDETPKDAALREMEEEMGVKLDIPLTEIGTFRAVNEDKTDIIIVYLGKVEYDVAIKLGDEHDKYRWLFSENIRFLPMHPINREILCKVYEGINE